jgi:hypothetical protein
MRKLLALSLVACVAVSMALAFAGCAQNVTKEEQPASTEQPVDTSGTMQADTTAHDSM